MFFYSGSLLPSSPPKGSLMLGSLWLQKIQLECNYTRALLSGPKRCQKLRGLVKHGEPQGDKEDPIMRALRNPH